MKDFFKNLDLYKVIVLLSLVLLPLGGWWITKIDEQIGLCRRAKDEATRAGGLLEEIGQYQRKIEIVAQTRGSAGVSEPVTWFEGQIMSAGVGIGAGDFTIDQPKDESTTIGKQRVTDYVVRIDWKELKVQMDFIYAVLFNCESGATRNAAIKGQPSVWRLRELTLVNATGDRKMRRGKVPPPELLDSWEIKQMTFARREPKAGS